MNKHRGQSIDDFMACPKCGIGAFQVAQLRHAYEHLKAERVTNQREFADGLIAPAIRYLERIAEDAELIEIARSRAAQKSIPIKLEDL